MPIRYVCFDLGGVVVRICHSFVEAAQTAGLQFLDDARLHEPDAIARRRELILAHQVGALTMQQYCEQMSTALEGLYSADQVRGLHAAWLLEEYPGVHDLMAELSERTDVQLACLSNTNDGHWEQMLGSQQVFRSFARLNLRLASHLLRLAKPELAIYESAISTFGCLPSEVLFFDDLIENVLAAREAGWDAEQIDPKGDTAAQMRRHLGARGLLLTQA